MKQRNRQSGNNKPNAKAIAPATNRKELGILNAAPAYPGVWLPEKTPGRER